MQSPDPQELMRQQCCRDVRLVTALHILKRTADGGELGRAC